MTLAERLNLVIREQGLTKAQFARQTGISENYVYILTGNSRPDSELNKHISPTLAKLIAVQFGYQEDWVLSGTLPMRPDDAS